MRATMELYGDAMECPSIHAQIALGTEDLTVKVKPCCCIHGWFSRFLFFFNQNSPVKMLEQQIPLYLYAMEIDQFLKNGVIVWGYSSDPLFFFRWVIVEEACRCARLRGCSPTRTPQLLGPALTGPELLLWSVFRMYDQWFLNNCGWIWTHSTDFALDYLAPSKS